MVMSAPWASTVLLSTLWIIYRVYLVFQKPVEELEEVLGVDIPPSPDVTLSTITETTVLLFWKYPDQYHSAMERYVQVNGIRVGPVHRTDQTVHVTRLRPGHHYSIRAVSTNAAGNSTYSRFIQVQTTPEGGHKGIQLLSLADHDHAPLPPTCGDAADSDENEEAARADASSEAEGDESAVTLKKKLDTLRRQRDDAERQLSLDTQEAELIKADLLKERDGLKQTVEEKEKISGETKKQLNEMEKQLKRTKNQKSAKEQALHKKKTERQKKKDDGAEMERQTAANWAKVESVRQQMQELGTAHEDNMAAVQQTIDEAQAQSKDFEARVQELGEKLRILKEKQRKANEEQSQEEQEAERQQMDEEQRHSNKMTELQARFNQLLKAKTQAEINLHHAQNRVLSLYSHQNEDPSRFLQALQEHQAAFYAPAQRRARQGNARNLSTSFPSGSSGGHSGFNSVSSISPVFGSAMPYYNPGSSMGSTNDMGLTQQDVEQLTGGAQMSPTANNLLPAGLLGDEDSPHERWGPSPRPLGTLDIHPYITGGDQGGHPPQSPLSVHSPVPSLGSPQASLHNVNVQDGDAQSIHSTHSPYNRALTATASAAGQSRRMSNLFGLSKQRGKSSLGELPSLGSLKASQTQSFPTSLDEPGAGGSRRKAGSGSWANPLPSFLKSQASPGAGAGAGASSNAGGGGEASSPAAAGLGVLPRRMLRGMRGSKIDPPPGLGGLDHHPHPATPSRPSSTYSHDAGPAPRSSSDNVNSPWGWIGGGGGGGAGAGPGPGGRPGQRASMHSADWGGPGGSVSGASTPWTRDPRSRRPSLQLGASTSNLSIGSTPLDRQDLQLAGGAAGAAQKKPAPIGTERFHFSKQRAGNAAAPGGAAPASSSGTATADEAAAERPTPRLNPAAPSFTTRLFNRTSAEARRASRQDAKTDSSGGSSSKDSAATETPAGKGRGPPPAGAAAAAVDESPPLSRRSRDTSHSIATTGSLQAEASDSPAPGADATTVTASPSTARESLMSRLTRKSSSTKFWKDRAGNAGAAAAAAAADAAAGSGSESGGGRAAGRFGKKGGAGADAAPGTPPTGAPEPGEEGADRAARSSLSWSRVMMGKGKARRSEDGARPPTTASGTTASTATTEEEGGEEEREEEAAEASGTG